MQLNMFIHLDFLLLFYGGKIMTGQNESYLFLLIFGFTLWIKERMWRNENRPLKAVRKKTYIWNMFLA